MNNHSLGLKPCAKKQPSIGKLLKERRARIILRLKVAQRELAAIPRPLELIGINLTGTLKLKVINATRRRVG